MPAKKKSSCRYCRKEIPECALFCPWCGEKQVGPKKARQPKYPAYRVLADGSLMGQLMLNGQRETIKADSEEEYKARIDALRSGVIELKKHPEKRPLKDIVRAYIDKNDGVLSPATIRGYEIIIGNRFPNYISKPFGSIDCQQMINTEAKTCAPKTVKNAWALITAALNDAKLPVPEVNLPAIPDSDEDFLDYEQILRFLDAIRGDPSECAALLMLHSLRTSEALKLDAADVQPGPDGLQLLVHGAVVPDKHNKWVEKATNKSRTSRREIPIMIPRLEEILPKEGKAITIHPSTVRTRIEKVCKRAGLPVCSPHDLRRSFASLAFHLGWPERLIQEVGGWNNPETVHRIYIKLAKKDVSGSIGSMRNYYKQHTENDNKKPQEGQKDSSNLVVICT